MGGLITAHHNDLRYGVSNLVVKAFTPAHMRDEPIIFTGHYVRGGKAKSKVKVKEAPPPEEGGEKGVS